MHNLRLLQLNNVRLSGGYQKFPMKLRWLCWHGFSLKFIPNDFTLDSLVVLEMQNSSLEQLWKRTKLLRSLKILDLSYSYSLTNFPDFSPLPNLERLILKYCINLVGIHESIGELGTLVLLNLEGCKNLRKLPKKVFLVKSLELILSGCLMPNGLPPDLGKMESLKVLHADGAN
ncbi:probable disease resistance protein RPP1 [Camellia sinensis]|uniref:probable disease resistance protein RPP1 n=1 Tax=Camellia sinensis TaxID=4442 RepID=UPI001035590E|nr:probable disease resistance protein RPP1 [Camellia sinensis]